jgi:hypothetical protein
MIMSFLYVLFFGCIDLLMFSFLTKRIRLYRKVRLGLIFFIATVLILHFMNPLNTYLPNHQFYALTLFSLALFVFHFGGELPVIIMKKIIPTVEHHPALSLFNFLRFYLVYILVFVFQCYLLFDWHP